MQLPTWQKRRGTRRRECGLRVGQMHQLRVPEYIVPKALDPRLLTTVAPAVAKAAIESGVARKKIEDWTAYQTKLEALMGYDNKMLRNFTDMAKQSPKRVVFAEANHVNMLTAAVTAYQEGICHPILLGNADFIKNLACDLGSQPRRYRNHQLAKRSRSRTPSSLCQDTGQQTPKRRNHTR